MCQVRQMLLAVQRAALAGPTPRTAPHCPAQVDGCGADLAFAKYYYAKSRLCEKHHKATEFTLDGHASRFCQQCCKVHRWGARRLDQGVGACPRPLTHSRR